MIQEPNRRFRLGSPLCYVRLPFMPPGVRLSLPCLRKKRFGTSDLTHDATLCTTGHPGRGRAGVVVGKAVSYRDFGTGVGRTGRGT
jgi:hypothetical protein